MYKTAHVFKRHQILTKCHLKTENNKRFEIALDCQLGDDILQADDDMNTDKDVGVKFVL